MMQQMRRAPVQVPGLGSVETAYAGPDPAAASSSASADGRRRPTFVLLHGFDSSSLEFRRFWPLLSALGDAYSVDLAGWGFTDYTPFVEDPDLALGPRQKRDHLAAFLDQVVGADQPIVLLGTSLGGAVALDFALHHPRRVDRLVLCDAQGFIDGIGPLSSMPRWLATLGVRVLRSVWLREAANQMAYHDKARYATDDALRIGRLHTHAAGWEEANCAFMRSGGYAISQRIPEVQVPTLVVWGRQDQILNPKYAAMFQEALPHAELCWLDACGHCGHLEQPQVLLDAVARFVLGEGEERGGCGRSRAEEAAVAVA